MIKEVAKMGRRARQEFEAKYMADRNYEILIEIYRRALRQQSVALSGDKAPASLS
jgi:hypothetical protein